MLAGTALLLLVAAAAPPADASPGGEHRPLSAADRRPLAFVLTTPTSEAGKVPTSELIRLLSAEINAKTGFFLQVSDQRLGSECKGLGCSVLQVRPDYMREALTREDGTVRPYADHVRDLKERKVAYPRYLIVASDVTLPGRPDRISTLLIDTDAALDVVHGISDSDPERDRKIEAGIVDRAIAAGPRDGELDELRDAERYVAELLERTLRPVFVASGDWQPFGEVLLTARYADFGVVLDGVAIGATRAGVTEIRDVRAGSHRLALERPGFVPFSKTFDTDAGERLEIHAELEPEANGATVMRRIVFWSGIGLAAVGAGTAAVAVARHDGSVKTACFATAGSGCASTTQFETTGYDPNTSSVNPPGVLLAPLGYSIAAGGAGWALGTAFIGEDTDVPWVPLAIGLVAGSLSYGLSAALNGAQRSPR